MQEWGEDLRQASSDGMSEIADRATVAAGQISDMARETVTRITDKASSAADQASEAGQEGLAQVRATAASAADRASSIVHDASPTRKLATGISWAPPRSRSRPPSASLISGGQRTVVTAHRAQGATQLSPCASRGGQFSNGTRTPGAPPPRLRLCLADATRVCAAGSPQPKALSGR